MGSDSDLPIMKEAAELLAKFGVAYELTIVSAHRTPKRLYTYATKAHPRGVKVIIAGAGGAAHLPGMVASMTPLPVLGVPVRTRTAAGIDSLFSIAQMPPGVPVATVAINGASNAGLLAVQILSTYDSRLQRKLLQYKKELDTTVIRKARKLEKDGFKRYLKQA